MLPGSSDSGDPHAAHRRTRKKQREGGRESNQREKERWRERERDRYWWTCRAGLRYIKCIFYRYINGMDLYDSLQVYYKTYPLLIIYKYNDNFERTLKRLLIFKPIKSIRKGNINWFSTRIFIALTMNNSMNLFNMSNLKLNSAFGSPVYKYLLTWARMTFSWLLFAYHLMHVNINRQQTYWRHRI